MSDLHKSGVPEERSGPAFPGPYGVASAGPVAPWGQAGAYRPQDVPGGYGVPPGYGPPAAWYPQVPYPVLSQTDPGIAGPWYGIGFFAAYRRFWKKYATFSGRASRGEFWWATLANFLVTVALGVVLALIATATVTPCTDYQVRTGSCPNGGSGLEFVALMYLYPAAILVPNLAITWRRLHDTGRSGAVFFVSLIPYIGDIVLLILVSSSSSPAGAKYDVAPAGAHGQLPYGPYASPPPYGYPPYGP